MRTIKAGLIAALALGGLLALTNVAGAQDAKQNRKGKMSPEARLEQLTKDLELTDAQKPKVKAVLEETQKKRQELDPSERRGEKARALMEDENKKLKEILTPDQFAKWKKIQEERAAKGKKKADEKKDSQ